MTSAVGCEYCDLVGGVCYPHRSGVLRLLEVPAYRGLILSFGADGGPAGAGPESAPDPTALPLALEVPCRHRGVRWNCGGAMTMTCLLGLGQAGIVDEHDCRACPSPNLDPGPDLIPEQS